MKFTIKKIILSCLALGLLGGTSVFAVLFYYSLSLPKIETLADYRPSMTSKILAKDGTVLAERGNEKREIVNIEDVPEMIINAFLSAEDAGFFDHSGVDYLGLTRAMLANIKAGRVVQGGSTITQQVAKSLLLTRERSISRKVKDFLLAQKIEEKFNKKEILFLYLNQVYLGGGYYGIKSAFEGYFNKTLKEATVAEAAMIAGLLVAPGKYSPYINPKRAKTRQGYVLKRMFANGKITKEEYDNALKERVIYQLRKKKVFKAGYFTDWVRQRVIEVVGGKEEFLNGGYTVHTTLDWSLQKVAEKEVEKGVRAIDKRQGYKGPLSHVEDMDLYFTELSKRRSGFYRDQSTYFSLDEKLQKSYEYFFEEEELEKIKIHRDEFKEKVGKLNRVFKVGNLDDDKILPLLKESEIYKGVITSIDDNLRIMFVDVMGITGVIPYKGFRWVHERIISENKNIQPYLTRPSTAFKTGDVIEVSIVNKSVKLLKYLHKRLEGISEEKIEILKGQNYLLCHLEQTPDAQGALVAINPKTNEIMSMVGGWDFSRSQFNRAVQSNRQPGSSFKPLLFAAGLENGYTPASIIMDSPEALGGVDETLNWKPRNYDGKFKGPITFRESLEQSRNIPTIKIAEKMGVRKILDFAKRIGFKAEIDKDLSMALGSFGVTLLDIVATYGIFPNGGKIFDPKSIISIKDRDGREIVIEENKRVKQRIEEALKEEENEEFAEVLEKDNAEISGEEEKKKNDEEFKNPFLENLGGEQVYDKRLAYIMTNLMRGIIENGTGKGAKNVSPFIGGKTGTTNSYVDAWFLGFSSNIVTGVWTGFDDNKTLGWGETGAKAALPIWRTYMQEALKKHGEYDFKVPSGIINVKIDRKSGRLASHDQKAYIEAFVEGTEPGAGPSRSFMKKSDPNEEIYEDDDFFNR